MFDIDSKLWYFMVKGFHLPISPQGFAISVWGISHGREEHLIFLEIPSHSAKMVLSVERIRKKTHPM